MTFHPVGAWSIYLFLNTLAYYFNINLVISIFRLQNKKTTIDILLAGLASGFLISVTGCFFPCFLNLIMNGAAFLDQVCFTEAYLHVVGMVIQFLNVAGIAFRTYVGVSTKKPTFTPKKAYLTVFFSWIIAFSGTYLFGYFSDVSLVTSGTFCFFSWTSIVLLGWAWPIAAIAAFLMCYWYWKIYVQMKQVKQMIHQDPTKESNIAMRLASLVLLFIFGYSGMICQSLFETFAGHAAIWADITAACIVLSYWVAAPLAYAYANQRLKLPAVLYCSPALLGEENEEISVITLNRSPMSPMMSQCSFTSKHTQSPSKEKDIELLHLSPSLDNSSTTPTSRSLPVQGLEEEHTKEEEIPKLVEGIELIIENLQS